jgi:hypothetical protein
MKPKIGYFLSVLTMAAILLYHPGVLAWGETSMITLEFPVGAENTGLAESGVSLSNSIAAMFWNPAALPAVYDNVQTRVQTSFFNEHPLNINDIDHRFIAGALFLNDLLPVKNLDVAYGYYNIGLRAWGEKEVVNAHCLGVRVLDMFSLGVSLKTFNNELPVSAVGTLKSNGFACDLGARFEYNARIASSPVTLSPELGVSVVNLGGGSAWSVDSSVKKKPVPRGFYIGSSLTTQFLEFCSYTITAEGNGSLMKRYWSNGSDYRGYGGHSLIVSLSNRFQITPFYSYGFGYLVDYTGRRFEFHDVHTVTFDTRKLLSIMYRIKNCDFEPGSENVEKFQGKWSLFKGKIKPNIRFVYSTSNINSIDGNTRDGQRGIDFSLGF